MNTLPAIGAKVRYTGKLQIGPCCGTVLRITKSKLYPDDADWDDPDYIPEPIGDAPIPQWKAWVRVDQIPTNWPYQGRDTFVPEVGEIELVTP